MTNRKTKIDPKLKKFVQDSMRDYRWAIGVTNFRGDIIYMKEDQEGGRDGCVTVASMSTDRRYLRGTLKIYPDFVKRWKAKEFDECRRIIAHEVAHLATQHMMDLCTSCYKDEGETKDAWESLTEVVGRMAHEIIELEKKKK